MKAERPETHHKAHPSKLDGGISDKERADELPAGLALVFPTGQDDQEGNEGGELDDGCEGEQEAATAPDGAEELVVTAVVVVGEVTAIRVVEGRAALVQT